MEAACHKDRSISKKAVECIHDSMAVLLNEQMELPHFHFNEALFKPFENLLCLELCDSDVQDQVKNQNSNQNLTIYKWLNFINHRIKS